MGFLKTIGKAIGSVASPLISGAFGIGGSFLNNKAQESANKTNMQIAQMNNEWSERMMEKQHLYDVEMWNKNNEYNDPSQQVARLRAAGINPALALGNISPGSASGGNSVGLPSPSSTRVDPLKYDGFVNSINNSVQLAMQLDKHQSEMHSLGVNTAMNEAYLRAKIAEMYQETRSKKFRNELDEITKDIQVGMRNEQFLKTINERYLVEEQEKLVKQQRIYQTLVNEKLPEEISMRISVMASQRDLNRKNIESTAKDIVLKAQEAERTNYSKEQYERLKDATVRALESGITQGWISSVSGAVGNVLNGIGSIGRKPMNVYSPHRHTTYIRN